MNRQHTRACLSAEEIDRYLSRASSDPVVAQHVQSCSTCSEAVREHRANNDLLSRLQASFTDGTVATAPATIEIEGYDVMEEVHRGAQGIVFRAMQRSANRVVALKLLLAGAFATSQQRRRFEREIELVAGLDHPNIVTVFDSGVTAGGQLYFAMQFIDGVTLDQWVAGVMQADVTAKKAHARRGVLRLFATISRAVHEAHVHGVIHRDLKPANVLVDAEGAPHIVDFGLAKVLERDPGNAASLVTQPGSFMGTAMYASPEQASGDAHAIDIRSDVYSLGVMLYECIARASPFDEAERLSDVIRAISERELPSPSSRNRSGAPIPRDLETIIRTATAHEPSRRYQSAAALADDLDRFGRGEAIDARRDSSWYVLRKAIVRHKVAAFVVSAFLVLLVTSSIAMTVLYRRAMNEAERVRTINIFLEDTIASIEAGEQGEPTMRDFLSEARHWVDLVLGDDPDAEASVRLIIGNGFRNIGLFEDAERELARSLEIRRAHFGEAHVEFAKGLNALGQLRFSEGNLVEAERLITSALRIREEQLGPASMDVALNRGTLARVYIAQDKLNEAETMLMMSLSARQTILGDDHPDTAMAQFSLAELLRRRGNLPMALSRHQEALRARRAVLHALHPDLARSLLATANVLVELDRAAEALPMLDEAAMLREEAFGSDHPRTIEARAARDACAGIVGPSNSLPQKR